MAKLNQITGKNVYTEKGERVGTFKDVIIDSASGRVLGILIEDTNKDFLQKLSLEEGRGLSIPYRAVGAIEDVVILKDNIYEAHLS